MSEETYSLRVERIFEAAPEAVFSAWTTPDLLKQWLHPADWSTPTAEVDLRVGGTYRWGVCSPDGGTFYEVGVFREISPPKRLVYTCRYEHDTFEHDMPDEEMLVTVELEDLGGRTRCVVVQEGYERIEDRDDQQNGWPAFLDTLAKLVEKG